MRIPLGTKRYIHDGSGQLDKGNSQDGDDSETFVMVSDAAEFVNKVKDQVRSGQKRMSIVAGTREEHSIIWGMFMAATLNAATFMGKNFQDNQNSIMNRTDLTLKKKFDTFAKLVSEQDEIFNVDKIHCEKLHGNICYWLVAKPSSVSNAPKSMSSRIQCCASEGFFNILIPTKLGRIELQGSNPR